MVLVIRNPHILKGFLAATAFQGIWVISYYLFTLPKFLNRIAILMGGNYFEGGYIQHATFVAFFWAIFEIKKRYNDVGKEFKHFSCQILPTGKKHLLLPSDVPEIHHRSEDYLKKKGPSVLVEMISHATLKYRSTNSIPELMDLISLQTQINQEKSESSLSNLRYLSWVIPSIGFIGTVLGISQALSIAHTSDMNAISQTLGVAFDTTLVSLILSVVSNWQFHRLQESTDKLHAEAREFVIHNLVNRIEHQSSKKAA